ncbi:hypothetical protein MPTA5024_32850 [Microbispora sp. ATCC PTA-5024]|nr:hypothetical protein MPTA5024_32850 [Microbispora sp. ATCC PTA-5024]
MAPEVGVAVGVGAGVPEAVPVGVGVGVGAQDVSRTGFDRDEWPR